ncbi:conjugal transfer protein TraD [Chryseobacterium sp. 'Rf worker isolate 10']|uniref:conjugal transfer protein TraD n=1 Tax=Chryseobacterium sp. 'Rf worker isolate 10' TaxID=2887348 RepID=UPI003D6ED287
MEIMILICLILVVILLLQDKIIIRKAVRKEELTKRSSAVIPDIMGGTRSILRHSLPAADKSSQMEKEDGSWGNFEPETGGKAAGIEIPQEEPDEPGEGIDLKEEEEEWSEYGVSQGDNGFATGVTFEELSTVGMLLQQPSLEVSQEETAVRIVQKLQGTELFSLLENSMEGASQRMAELLEKSLSSVTVSGSSSLRDGDVDQFDIREFV